MQGKKITPVRSEIGPPLFHKILAQRAVSVDEFRTLQWPRERCDDSRQHVLLELTEIAGQTKGSIRDYSLTRKADTRTQARLSVLICSDWY